MKRLRVNIGPGLILCFVLVIVSSPVVGEVIVLRQFPIVQPEAEQFSEYDAELVDVLDVPSSLLTFRDAL